MTPLKNIAVGKYVSGKDETMETVTRSLVTSGGKGWIAGTQDFGGSETALCDM